MYDNIIEKYQQDTGKEISAETWDDTDECGKTKIEFDDGVSSINEYQENPRRTISYFNCFKMSRAENSLYIKKVGPVLTIYHI